MVTEYFIANTSSAGTAHVSQTPSKRMKLSDKLVLIIRLKERLVFNYFVNFLDGRAYIIAFPGALEPQFNFFKFEKSDIASCLLVWLEFTLGIGYMIGSSFKEEWCTFSRNHFAGSSAQMVSTEPGLRSTQQTSYTRIITTGFTTLVMTRKFWSTMTILIYMFETNWTHSKRYSHHTFSG